MRFSLPSVRSFRSILGVRRAAGIGSAVLAGVLMLGTAKDLMAKGKEPPAAKGGDDVSKYSIEQVMKKAYKGDDALVKRVINGKATKEDVHLLVELNKALAAGKPEKGDAADWNKRTAALVSASEAIEKGDRNGIAALKAASNCKGCHSLHKPD